MPRSHWFEQAAALRKRLTRRASDGRASRGERVRFEPGATSSITANRLQGSRAEATAEVSRAYRAILGRAADEGALAHYAPSVQNGSLTIAEICAELVHSAEFAARLRRSPADGDERPEPAPTIGGIDAPGEAGGLRAELEVDLATTDAPTDGRWAGTARVTNAGTATWPPPSETGRVRLGVHLHDDTGGLVEHEHARIPLPIGDDGGDGPGLLPGSTLEVPFSLPAPSQPGRYRLRFDVVSEHTRRFGTDGSPTVELEVTSG